MGIYTNISKNSKRLFFAWYLLIMMTSSVPYLPTPKIQAFDSSIRLDYLIHFLQFFILAIFFMQWRINVNSNIKIKMLFIYGIGGMAAAFLSEMYQKLIPGRTFNPVDGLSNFAGIVMGIFCVYLINVMNKQNLDFTK
ncbi:MAG TPA: VanZ family protein [Candidatus Kapabacteria bacterium]|nr:VanZ family protein [Candidatus Kapabacteria bacterium]